MSYFGKRMVRPALLLALVPASLICLAIAFWVAPATILTPFNGWLLIEIFLGFSFLLSYYLSSKYHLAREVPFIIAGLVATMLVVLSYVTVDVQRIAFAVTAIATSAMYFRVIAEFRRRKYT
jgi:hypothetical protein